MFARQCPKWRFPRKPYSQHGTKTVTLEDVDEDIGHTLVHYLYTGAYETLNSEESPSFSRSMTEYKRACLVYCAAKRYELEKLAQHAAKQMELFDKELSLSQILDVARDVHPNMLESETWFPKYLKMKLEIAFEADMTVFTQEQFLNLFDKAASFNKALVSIMAGILTSKIASAVRNEGKTKLFTPLGSTYSMPIVIEDCTVEEFVEEPAPWLRASKNPIKDCPPTTKKESRKTVLDDGQLVWSDPSCEEDFSGSDIAAGKTQKGSKVKNAFIWDADEWNPLANDTDVFLGALGAKSRDAWTPTNADNDWNESTAGIEWALPAELLKEKAIHVEAAEKLDAQSDEKSGGKRSSAKKQKKGSTKESTKKTSDKSTKKSLQIDTSVVADRGMEAVTRLTREERVRALQSASEEMGMFEYAD